MPARLDVLTAAQRRAVTHEGGPLLVLGGPGTGKTRVLVERFAWLVDQGVPPEELLLVTRPTRARRRAAPPGRGPADAAVRRARRASASPTSASRLLREHAPAAGVDPFFVPGDRAPTASRCCSTASSSSRCAATTSSATPRRCSAR